jgi:hypothetical protein
MAEIGDILIRKKGDGPKRLEIVASHAGDWITRDADEFGPTEARSPNDLRTFYGGDGESADHVDEYTLLMDPAEREAAKLRLAESMNKARIVEYENSRDALSPEDVFSMSPEEQAEVRAKKAKQIEKRLREAQIGY